MKTTARAELCQRLQHITPAGFQERPQISRNLGSRESIEPVLFSHSSKLLLFDRGVKNKARDIVKQFGSDNHLKDYCGMPQRPNEEALGG